MIAELAREMQECEAPGKHCYGDSKRWHDPQIPITEPPSQR
jgi:hypothetical protein